jgi:hypothetical protein
MPQAAPQLFQRASEVALGVSFNAQSQAPDIPGASSRAAVLRHTASLQAQPKAPDIYALRAYTGELLASLNDQAQTPENPSQTLASDFHLLSLRPYMEELSASFNAQDQARTFPFNKCHKTVHRNSLNTYCHCLTRVVRGLSSMCVLYAFQLLGKVWFVFIVLVLDLLGLLR